MLRAPPRRRFQTMTLVNHPRNLTVFIKIND
jgi:hypothetical protein